VLVRIEVEPTTPVTDDTVARLEPQGITGVFYVQLTGGTTASERLTTSANDPAQIPGQPSTIDLLVTDAPELLNRGVVLLERATSLLDDDNLARITDTLDNLERLEGAPAGEPEPAPEGKGYIVRVVELRDITVHADLLPEGGEMTRASVRVPAITLRDVGTAADPVSLPEMTSIVVRALLTAAIEAPGLPDGMLDDLRGRLEALGSLGAAKLDMARQEADKAADKARDAAEGLADDAADAIDSAAGGLGERLRGLRPGGGKEGDGDGGKDGQKQPQEPAQEPAKDPG